MAIYLLERTSVYAHARLAHVRLDRAVRSRFLPCLIVEERVLMISVLSMKGYLGTRHFTIVD